MMNLIVEDYFEKLGVSIDSVISLSPDGSERQFYRLKFRNKLAVAIFPAPAPIGPAEAQSFVKIALHLSTKGINVPRLLFFDEEFKVAIVEDKGNISLHKYLQNGIGDFEEIYGNILTHLADFQINGVKGFDPNWCYDTQSYNSALAWEREILYFINSFLKKVVKHEPEQALYNELEKLALEVDTLHYKNFLLHRDFQSRNILMQDRRPWIIDFQAARLGPLSYDVASLLVDPYISMDCKEWPRLLSGYIEYINVKFGLNVKTDLFLEDFAKAALLRTLQVLGAFSFLSHEKGKTFFAHFIPMALARLREILDLFYPSSLYNLRKVVEHLHN